MVAKSAPGKTVSAATAELAEDERLSVLEVLRVLVAAYKDGKIRSPTSLSAIAGAIDTDRKSLSIFIRHATRLNWISVTPSNFIVTAEGQFQLDLIRLLRTASDSLGRVATEPESAMPTVGLLRRAISDFAAAALTRDATTRNGAIILELEESDLVTGRNLDELLQPRNPRSIASAVRQRDLAPTVGDISELIEAEIGPVLRQVESSLRERTRLLSGVAIRAAQAENIRHNLDQLVQGARREGASWADIGAAAGISGQAAHRRWDASARQKHSEYQRERSRSREPGSED